MTDSGLTGYRREGRGWGIRNHVLVLPVRMAANLAAERLAAAVPGAVAVSHQWEGGDADPDAEIVHRTLANFASNPNLAAVLMVGITGADRAVAERVRGRVEFIAMADHRGTNGTVEAGLPVLSALVAAAAEARREPMPPSGLVLGLECGGSDALSGITANPALGVASDLLVGAGGTSVLAESSELIGAEHLLAARAVSPEVGRRVLEVIHRFEDSIRELGFDVRGAQPAPGNIEGGLTTIEEKSLGAAKKGGDAAVAGVLEFAEMPARAGLHVMDTPGHDIEQMTGMVAGGCTIACFTTGRGTPTGCAIVPVIKIATNTAVFERMGGDLDLNAGAILDGLETLQSMGDRIYRELIEVAAGRLTSAEVRGNREFAVCRNWGGAAAPAPRS